MAPSCTLQKVQHPWHLPTEYHTPPITLTSKNSAHITFQNSFRAWCQLHLISDLRPPISIRTEEHSNYRLLKKSFEFSGIFFVRSYNHRCSYPFKICGDGDDADHNMGNGLVWRKGVQMIHSYFPGKIISPPHSAPTTQTHLVTHLPCN